MNHQDTRCTSKFRFRKFPHNQLPSSLQTKHLSERSNQNFYTNHKIISTCLLPRYLQGFHSFRCWFGGRFLWPGGRFCHWHRWWRRCPRHSPTASSVRRYDLDPHFRRSIGSLRSDRCHLPVHEISAQLTKNNTPSSSRIHHQIIINTTTTRYLLFFGY